MTTLAPLVAAWIGAIGLGLLDGRNRAVKAAACCSVAATLLLTIRLALVIAELGPVGITTGGWPPGIGITLTADALGVAFAMLSQSVLLAALLYHAMAGERSERLPGFVLFMAAGLTGLFLTADAFNFYVFFEVSMVSAFGMTAHGRRRREVTAGLLFVTLNMLGSAIFLLSVGGLYRLAGTLQFDRVAEAIAAPGAPAATGIGALLLAAFSLKLGLFPFHAWLPDVYRDLRPEVAAIFGGALTNIGAYGLLRFGAGLLASEVAQASGLLIALGTASILYGGIAAVGARTVTGVLAWSAVGQAGYIVVALGFASTAALTAAVVYALVTAATKTLLFLAAGLHGRMVPAAFAAGAFSLAGVPPFAGFIAKTAVFRSAVDTAQWTALALLVVGSALSFLYIFTAFQRRYWSGQDPAGPDSPVGARLLVLSLGLLLALAGAWPTLVLESSAAGAAALTGGAQ